jgi:hypothetical protein
MEVAASRATNAAFVHPSFKFGSRRACSRRLDATGSNRSYTQEPTKKASRFLDAVRLTAFSTLQITPRLG